MLCSYTHVYVWMLKISAQAVQLWEEATDPEELVWEMNRLEGWDRVWPPNGDLLPASTSGNSALTTASTAGSIAAW
jgi:hypothetical protein